MSDPSAVVYKACPVCSQPALLDAARCGRCGHTYRTQFIVVAPAAPARYHSRWLAGFLAFCLAGAGQCYNRQWAKGLVLFLLTVLIGVFSFGTGALVWLGALLDALAVSGRIARGEKVTAWTSF